jgi:hypothetical protein
MDLCIYLCREIRVAALGRSERYEWQEITDGIAQMSVLCESTAYPREG